jgi:CO/xanthine dehydrogenase Mo-binding subunit
MIDAEAKVVGLARYTMDLYPRGVLYAKVKRSPSASEE